MSEENQSLNSACGAGESDAARKRYEGWAESYDAENIGNGYRVPGIGCAMVARHVGKDTGLVYDAACGTGIVGGSLALLGYTSIVGSDLSPAMLKYAEGTSFYQRLYTHDLSEKLPEDDNGFTAVTCFGALGPGHAPADCIDEFVRITRPGGHIIFSTRAETYREQALKGKVDELSDSGAWTLLDQSEVFQSYYLTQPDFISQVLVFEVS